MLHSAVWLERAIMTATAVRVTQVEIKSVLYPVLPEDLCLFLWDDFTFATKLRDLCILLYTQNALCCMCLK